MKGIDAMHRTSRTLMTCFVTLLASCAGGGGDGRSAAGTGSLTITATDASLDHSMVTDARIWMNKLTIHTDADAESGFLTV
jgi:hypothetical protein